MKSWNYFLFLNIFILFLNPVLAQKATISEKLVPMITYPFSDPDPVPAPGRIYPYFSFEGYSAKGTLHTWKMVEMENDYIKLWITPEIGGKIWGAVEKSTGKEFIYYNHVVKFRDVAMRGPWTSGGIEINFGIIGHAPTCSSPVDYMMRENEDGSVSCFVGAIDLPSHTRWSVEINLPGDKAYFTTRSFWDNPTLLVQSYYHWMNLGIKTAGNLEYIFPGSYYLGHDGSHSPWPVNDQGRNLSFYENNDFGSYKSYHVSGETTDFYGAYWHDDDFGFGHYSPYDEKPGKKIWIWGLSDQGMIWEKLLTDTDGQYTEIQSGRLFNQAAQSSSFTPFKNREFTAGQTDEWTEYWFPVKGTKGLKYGVPEGSVNLIKEGINKVGLWYCPNSRESGKLEVRNGKVAAFSKDVQTIPMQPIKETFDFPGEIKNLSVWLNDKLLYEADREKHITKRPVESPEEFNWESAYGHYLKGKELERQRLYNNASDEYRKSLAVDPYLVPALTGIAGVSYRRTDYNASLNYALKALSIDTYDADANMMYGIAALALGDTTSAIDGFSVASAGLSRRCAAYNALASVYIRKGDYGRALSYSEKSLNYNRSGSEGIQLKILSLRKLNLHEKWNDELMKLDAKDPLNHFIKLERYITDSSPENKKQIHDKIINELPHETYLEHALWYYKNGQQSDALKILELANREKPEVLLWKGYLNHLTGNDKQASIQIGEALQISPFYVFPYRTETLLPLEWAKSVSSDWKIKYYTGLIYLNAGDTEKGIDLWEKCGNEPDFYPFYIARSVMAEPGSSGAEADIDKAMLLAPEEWRAGLFASRFYLERGKKEYAEELIKKYYAKQPQNYYLALHLAKMLALNNKYADCVNLLRKTEVLPNEGATEGRIVWRNANIGNALDEMKSEKYRKALESIGLAKQWPANLGVGRPYEVDERLEDFISMLCYRKMKDKVSEGKMKDKATFKTGKIELSSDQNDFLTAWLLKESGNRSEADLIMNDLVRKNPSSKKIQWCSAVYSGNMELAKSIAENIDNKDRDFLFLMRIFNEWSSLF